MSRNLGKSVWPQMAAVLCWIGFAASAGGVPPPPVPVEREANWLLNQFIQKPFSVVDLTDKIRQVLDEAAQVTEESSH